MATIADHFMQAVRLHQSGNLAGAEALYREVLRADPRHGDAYHLLGVLANQTGQHDVGISLIQQALTLRPGSADFHANLGIAYIDQGRLAEGAEALRQALLLNPNDVDTRNNLGNVLVRLGQLEGAAACFEMALQIDPNYSRAHYNLGNLHLGAGRPDRAVEFFQNVLRLDPRHADAQNNLGSALYQLGDFENAANCYRQALHINPLLAEAHNNLGNVLKEQGEVAAAESCFREAARLGPNLANAHFNLGNLLYAQGRFAEAASCYRHVLSLNPNHADAANNLGNALKDQGQLAEAAQCYHQALQTNPQHVNAHNNLGNALMGQGHLAAAATCYEQALALDPEHDLTILNRAHLRLLQGDFKAGWHDYERRFTQAKWTPRPFAQPRWDGTSLHGKTILVLSEQGLGDTIQFTRYLPLVKERGGRVLYECPAGLCDLTVRMNAVDQVIPFGDPLPPFDVHIPLMSLPGLLGTTLATIPADVPYFRADPALTETWRQEVNRRLPANDKGLNVGIVWQGSLQLLGDPRPMLVSQFAPLARTPGVNLVSLQVGPGTAQLAEAQFPIVDLGSHFNLSSLNDIAAALPCMDLVVTIDTAVAHLAGALGVRVWVALPFVSCWRWLLDRTDSPWYPTMRLFRQTRPGDWTGVMDQIAQEIQKVTSDERSK